MQTLPVPREHGDSSWLQLVEKNHSQFICIIFYWCSVFMFILFGFSSLNSLFPIKKRKTRSDLEKLKRVLTKLLLLSLEVLHTTRFP